MSNNKRYIQEKIIKGVLATVTLLIVLLLFSILGGIFVKGLPALNWEI